MAFYVANMPSLLTSAGGSTTNAVGILDDAYGLTIFAPATLDSTGVGVEIEPTSTGTSFTTLQSGGSDVVFTQGKATVIAPVPFRQLRLVCTGAESVARTFRLTKTAQT